jgi:hypothetical protein
MHERFGNRVDLSVTDEIALNPKHILERPPEETAQHASVHEMGAPPAAVVP